MKRTNSLLLFTETQQTSTRKIWSFEGFCFDLSNSLLRWAWPDEAAVGCESWSARMTSGGIA